MGNYNWNGIRLDCKAIVRDKVVENLVRGIDCCAKDYLFIYYFNIIGTH